MAAIALPEDRVKPLAVPGVAWIAVAIGLLLAYLMLQENGTLLASSWETLHELYHDGRHAIGVPCH
ncbi:MAG: CbtB-domain containing protein [Acidimicrobiales bacterium]|nr:CbtB-domain containing protein [Acidimicrobiales bacterium]